MILDLFSGIRGWEALTDLSTLGIDHDEDATETARLNGYETILADIRKVHLARFAKLEGLIASPSCVPFSASGKGDGRLKLHSILESLRIMTSTTKRAMPALSDDVSLVLEPMRFILACDPDWIALEQVPSVQKVWDAYGVILEGRGYSVATGILSAEQYGLGTTRKRAFLIASRKRSVSLPRPTHSAFYPHRPDFIDPGFPRWKSMADILGWGMTGKPAGTVTAGGTSSGGAEPFGNGQRQSMLVEYGNGRWEGAWNPRPDVLDLAKLQSFPGDYKFYGRKGSVSRQIGNAVPPLLGKLVLEQVV